METLLDMGDTRVIETAKGGLCIVPQLHCITDVFVYYIHTLPIANVLTYTALPNV
jgi:hypothetical protein